MKQLLFTIVVSFLLIPCFSNTAGLVIPADDKALNINSIYLTAFESNDPVGLADSNRKVLKKTKKHYGAQSVQYLEKLSLQIQLLKKLEKFKKAINLQKKAKEIAKTIYGENHPVYLNQVISETILQQLYEEVLPSPETIDEVREKKKFFLQQNYPGQALHLTDLGKYYELFGRHILDSIEADDKNALLYYQKALELIKVEFGPNHIATVYPLKEIGLNYLKKDQIHLALIAFEDALRVCKTGLETNHPVVGDIKHKLALIYYSIGLEEKADQYFRESLLIYKNALGSSFPTYGDILSDYSLLLFDLGQKVKALDYISTALNIIINSRGENHISFIIKLHNLSSIYHSLRDKKQKKSIKESTKLTCAYYPNTVQAFVILDKLDNPRFDVSSFYSYYNETVTNVDVLNIAQLLIDIYSTHKERKQYESQNDPALFKTLFTLRFSSESKFNDHNFDLNMFRKMLYEEKEVYEKASKYYREAQLKSISRIYSLLPRFSEEEQQAMLKKAQEDYCKYQSFLIKYPNLVKAPELGLENVYALKGIGLKTQQEFLASLRNVGHDDIGSIYEEWSTLSAEISKQSTLPNDQKLPSLDSLKERANYLGRRIAADSLFDQLVPEMVSWQNAQNQLKPNEAMVEFASFNYFGDDGQVQDSILYFAYVCRPDWPSPKMIPLFSEKEFTDTLKSANANQRIQINRIYTRGLTREKGPLPLKVYGLVWEPIDSLLNGIEKVYFSPSGILHQINLSAIPNSDSTRLGDSYTFYQMGSTRQLANRAASIAMDSLNNAIVYGDIKYTIDSRIHWPSLSNTGIEADSISSVLNKHTIHTTSLKGSDATEESFKALGKNGLSPDIIHIPTHGYFSPKPDTAANRATTDQNGLPFKSSEHPLIRSGLIFAGANRKWTGGAPIRGQEDGILTAYEISQMNLSNTELVVLSACNTGLGDIQGNEGVFGLQRAFKMAGVKYLIMSLWEVPDEATQVLMTKFYQNWIEAKMPIHQAFYEAQRWMRSQEEYANPVHWAGFVLVE